MNDSLPQIAALIKSETGVILKEPQMIGLEATIRRLAPGVEQEDFLERLDQPDSGDRLLARLVDAVTVQETYFFRDERELRSIQWRELRDDARASRRRQIRVWVPACASGEEAYTLALMSVQALGLDEFPVTILGTDVAFNAIAAARTGAYGDRSMRRVPAVLRERYFATEGKDHRIQDPIKAMTRFQLHNLVKDPSPPAGEAAFDLIVCRNLLIYFDKETVERAVASLEAALRPGGELILGAADRLSGTTARLASIPASLNGNGRVRESGRPRAADGLAKPSAPERVERVQPAPEPKLDAAPEDADRGDELRELVAGALSAADGGDLERALEITDEVMEVEPLEPDALFVRGLAQLGLDDAETAVISLRRCLYIDPGFGLAAFQLGRAHDALGDRAAAERAYQRALRGLEPGDHRHQAIVDQTDVDDLAAACRMRLDAGREVVAP